jgi:phosphatidylserine decarboxylase
VEKEFIEELIKKVAKAHLPLDPLIEEFKAFVEKDATLHMQYSQMFTEVTHSWTPTNKPQVQNYNQMFALVNFIMLTWAPYYNEYGLVGFPINAILNWSMGTINGYAAFLNKEANDYWMKVLNKWGEFLKSEKSAYILVEKPWGWFGEPAMQAMPGFADDFECDPTAPHWGFTSWDDFFVRVFREDRRPIATGDDVIANACESLPYDLQLNVQVMDEFWIKEQKYSLRHMFEDDPLTDQFIGGTIYQAFLSALSYHRWHSPIDGKVVKAYNVPGTYYSATLAVGEDEASPDKSQGYICQLAARCLMFIQADNPDIGLMCFMAVGMADVSTCELRAELIPSETNPEPVVKKGDEIGMFHFGGSTHCLMFRPSVNIQFEQVVFDILDGVIENPDNIHVNAKLATVLPPSKK